MTWTTLELAEASEAKGMAKGMAAGMAEGKQAGKAEALLKLLRLKFGELSADVETRVMAASAAQLDAWTEAVLTAESLDKLLATAPKR